MSMSEQPATALGMLHAMPHAVQLLGSARRLVSHPSAVLMLQSPQPALQAPCPHMPSMQVALVCCEPQAMPHAPQFCVSLLVSMQAPLQHFLAPPPQRLSSVQPGAQMLPP